MSDVFSLFEEGKVDADKFDNIDKEGASKLSNFIRQSIQIQKDIEDAEQHLKDLKFKKRKVKYIEKELLEMVRIVIKSAFSSYEDYQQYVFTVNKGLKNFYDEKMKEFEA